MADSMAERMISLGSCFSSNTSLKANANSFFIINLLPEYLYYTQKSGGCPLFDAFGIGTTTTYGILAYKLKRCKDLQSEFPYSRRRKEFYKRL